MVSRHSDCDLPSPVLPWYLKDLAEKKDGEIDDGMIVRHVGPLDFGDGEDGVKSDESFVLVARDPQVSPKLKGETDKNSDSPSKGYDHAHIPGKTIFEDGRNYSRVVVETFNGDIDEIFLSQKEADSATTSSHHFNRDVDSITVETNHNGEFCSDESWFYDLSESTSIGGHLSHSQSDNVSVSPSPVHPGKSFCTAVPLYRMTRGAIFVLLLFVLLVTLALNMFRWKGKFIQMKPQTKLRWLLSFRDSNIKDEKGDGELLSKTASKKRRKRRKKKKVACVDADSTSTRPRLKEVKNQPVDANDSSDSNCYFSCEKILRLEAVDKNKSALTSEQLECPTFTIPSETNETSSTSLPSPNLMGKSSNTFKQHCYDDNDGEGGDLECDEDVVDIRRQEPSSPSCDDKNATLDKACAIPPTISERALSQRPQMTMKCFSSTKGTRTPVTVRSFVEQVESVASIVSSTGLDRQSSLRLANESVLRRLESEFTNMRLQAVEMRKEEIEKSRHAAERAIAERRHQEVLDVLNKDPTMNDRIEEALASLRSTAFDVFPGIFLPMGVVCSIAAKLFLSYRRMIPSSESLGELVMDQICGCGETGTENGHESSFNETLSLLTYVVPTSIRQLSWATSPSIEWIVSAKCRSMCLISASLRLLLLWLVHRFMELLHCPKVLHHLLNLVATLIHILPVLSSKDEATILEAAIDLLRPVVLVNASITLGTFLCLNLRSCKNLSGRICPSQKITLFALQTAKTAIRITAVGCAVLIGLFSN